MTEAIIAISTYCPQRVKDPTTHKTVSAHKLGCTSAAAHILLALYGGRRARNVSPYANELDGERAAACIARFGATQAVRCDVERLVASNKAFWIVWLNPPCLSATSAGRIFVVIDGSPHLPGEVPASLAVTLPRSADSLPLRIYDLWIGHNPPGVPVDRLP